MPKTVNVIINKNDCGEYILMIESKGLQNSDTINLIMPKDTMCFVAKNADWVKTK